jgi:ATP-dependent exoDNAse (exonuclease V) beta subunit
VTVRAAAAAAEEQANSESARALLPSNRPRPSTSELLASVLAAADEETDEEDAAKQSRPKPSGRSARLSAESKSPQPRHHSLIEDLKDLKSPTAASLGTLVHVTAEVLPWRDRARHGI